MFKVPAATVKSSRESNSGLRNDCASGKKKVGRTTHYFGKLEPEVAGFDRIVDR